MATRAPQVPGGQPPSPLNETEKQALGVPDKLLPPADETQEQKIARLEAENQALKEAHGKTLPAAEPEMPETSDDEAYREKARGLRAKDVDATRLKRAVLTLDGWVCPATSPAPKAKE